jgi:hypothetical protein
MSKLDHAITIKVTDETAARITGLALLDGSDGNSDWVRHLVLRAIEEREKHFRALESIFAPRTADGEEYPVSRGLPASPFHGGR